ncbi:putative permease, partial [Variovorax sp. CF313]|uniref:LysM peptidoglycan-binding domain-containing protein n=1 Tax=Variovorax sp. CF313 TaxID=1144315 RepID=UPI0002714636
QMVVNGEVLGRYGLLSDTRFDGTPLAQNGPIFTAQSDFSFGYQPINGNYPAGTPGSYSVGVNDTLQTIAKGAYGDSSLWYLIADANGLSGNADLRAGQVLRIPAATSSANNVNSFKPYDPSKIANDSATMMAMPQDKAGGCGALGQIIMVVVAIVVTIYTAGAAAGAMGYASVGTAVSQGAYGVAVAASAAGAAAGSIASQAVGVAIGAQDSFSWKGVALAALGGAVSGGMAGLANGVSGLESLAGSGTGAAIARGAIGNALSQGIGVAVGLQDKFSWKGVAAAAVGAGVGSVVGNAMGMNAPSFNDLSFGEQFGRRLVTGLAAGAATAAMRGGRISATQVATDAFGNALGDSIAAANGQSSYSEKAFSRQEDMRDDALADAMRWKSPDTEGPMWDDGTPVNPYDRKSFESSVRQAYGLQTGDYNTGFSEGDGGARLVPTSWPTADGHLAGTTPSDRIVDSESSRRDPSIDGQFPSSELPVNGTALGYRDKSGAYFNVYHDGTVETAVLGTPSLPPISVSANDPDESAAERAVQDEDYSNEARRASFTTSPMSRWIDMSNQPAGAHSAEEWKTEASNFKKYMGPQFARDSVYNGLWTKGALLDIAAGNNGRKIWDQVAGVGIEANAHADIGTNLGRGIGNRIGDGLGSIMGMAQRGRSVVTPAIGANVPSGSSNTAVGNARLTERLAAWKAYQANGGEMSLQRWVSATQRQYGGVSGGYQSGFADWSRGIDGVHGNSLLAKGPHDIYVVRNADNGELLHFGETGRGYLTRFAEQQRYFAGKGINNIEVNLLGTKEGKSAAKDVELRYIETYIKVFGKRPPYNPVNH